MLNSPHCDVVSEAILKRFPTLLTALITQVSAYTAKRSAKPSRTKRSADGTWALASATSIAFSLAFFAGGLALLLGLVPMPIANWPASVDLGVLVLMVPLCALSLAIVAEVLRAAITTSLPSVQPPRLVAALSDWRPGHGEG